MKPFITICSVLILVLFSCKNEETTLIINDINVPDVTNSMQPFLFSNGNELLLSWSQKRSDSLTSIHYATFINAKWSTPITVAEEYNLFNNWADFPAIAKNNDNILLHYLQKSALATYAYDVRLMVSNTNGNTFNTDFLLHNDSTTTEHGFVSILPYKDDFFVSWLDGRNTMGGEHTDGHQSTGAMNLRAATILTSGDVIDTILLDENTCECCQTSAAITQNGPIVVYRDRMDNETRDIAITRWVDSVWTAPKPIHNDNWIIKGCPVNGPKADALGSTLVVAWFTASNNKPKVNVIFSNNNGQDFNNVVQIDSEKPLGRVDVTLLDADYALVSFMESTENNAALKVIKVHKDGTTSKPIKVSELSASRTSGFPQMELVKNTVYFAWNNVEGDSTSIKMKSIDATILN